MFGMKSRCEKKGHTFVAKTVTIRKKSSERREVCADYRAVVGICKYCDERVNVQLGEKVESWQEVSMPASMWDEMNKYGYLILN